MKSGCFGFYVQAPTGKHSTRSALNADNMSRKSGFSITGALKCPRIERELPHHPDTLALRRSCGPHEPKGDAEHEDGAEERAE